MSKLLNREITGDKELSLFEKKYLLKILQLTWNFFDKYVNVYSNFLPPDNVTKGEVSKFTSITNIGFYFLALICANKLELITDQTFIKYFKRSYNSLLKLSMHSGHFYNWYDVTTLQVHSPAFLSSVDSGNFYACMVCVKQYLSKFTSNEEYISSIDKMLQQMKFSIFINKFDQLSIGYFVKKKLLSKDNYDHFASESRLAAYIAIAKENKSESVWGTLLRPFNKEGALLSWGGTIFEYLLPQLFLNTFSSSLSEKSFQHLLSYNLDFSRKYNMPWGLSESLYLDETTKTYEYKPIGISELSRDPLQIQHTTIAPYATALMYLVDIDKTISNLKALIVSYT